MRGKEECIKCCLFSVVISLSCLSSQAYEPKGSMSRGLAGAGRALELGIEGAMLNPANFPSEHDYHIGGFFEETELQKLGFRTDLSGAVLDRNPEVLFPAVLSYRQTEIRGPESSTIEETDIQVSIGKPYNKWLAIGIGGRYLDQKVGNSASETYINGKIGILAKAMPELGFALVLDNVFDNHTLGLQPAVSLGSGYNFQNIARVGLDLVLPQRDNSEKEMEISLGFEANLIHGFQLRAGYKDDQLSAQRFGAGGLGWKGPKMGVNYAYEQSVEGNDQFTHSFDLRVYF